MASTFKAPVRLNIGRARLPRTDTSSQASFERQMRGQTQALIKNFTAWVKHMQDVSPEVLKESLKPTFDKSKVYTPKDTKALVNSAYLETRSFRGRAIVEMGFAKGGVPQYAAQVHENLEFYHKAPTQAKFLERAILEDAEALQKRITQGYKETSGV